MSENAKSEKKEVKPSAVVVTPGEFAKIPLDFVIATPLLTTIEAHKIAAHTTLEFVKGLLPDVQPDKDGNLSMTNAVTFKMLVKEKNAQGQDISSEREVTVPMIALVKVPSLNFDSLGVSFTYNISQIARENTTTHSKGELQVGTKGILAQFVNASFVGSVDHNRLHENTSNRGGSLEVKVHVSESQLPAGLQKIIDAVVDAVDSELPKVKK